ncbi:hypothetical protein quinque_006475 [Culex quinquefasciatus]
MDGKLAVLVPNAPDGVGASSDAAYLFESMTQARMVQRRRTLDDVPIPLSCRTLRLRWAASTTSSSAGLPGIAVENIPGEATNKIYLLQQWTPVRQNSTSTTSAILIPTIVEKLLR